MNGERIKEIAVLVREQTGADPGTESIIEGALLSVFYRALKDVEDQCYELIRHDVSLKHRVDSLKNIVLTVGSKKTKALESIKEIADGSHPQDR